MSSKYEPHQAIFEHIQNNGDVISSILILYEYLKDNNVDTTLDIEILRSIALMSCDKHTLTHLWHINALIASSFNLKSLLLGMEMMFNQYLGNKKSFQLNKHKILLKKQRTNIINNNNNLSPMKKRNQSNNSINNNRNKIISLVQSLQLNDKQGDSDTKDENEDDDDHQEYDTNCSDSEDDEDDDDEYHTTDDNDTDEVRCIDDNNQENRQITNQMKPTNTRIMVSCHDHNKAVDFNKQKVDFDKREPMTSPQAFRMRQKKRMMQNDRNLDAEKSLSMEVNVGNFDDDYEPIVHSPFNINKLAQKVDRVTLDVCPYDNNSI